MTQDESNSWDFWSKVYTNRELRQSMDEKSFQSDVPMSQLLRCSSLARAELLVQNVPRMTTSQENAIRQLIKRELDTDVPILNIEIAPKQWILRFYRRQDASRVLRELSGHIYRGRVLHVTLQEVNTHVEVTPTMEVGDQREEEVINPNWASVEWNEICSFRNDIIALLRLHSEGLSVEEALADPRVIRRRGFIPCVLHVWTLGFMRILSPQVRMVGRYLSLPEQGNLSSLIRITVAERVPRVVLEEWEPVAPSDIRSDPHFLDYMIAMLSQFGPQHVELSLPLRILATTISANWPRSSRELAEMAVQLSPSFVLIDDTLYMASSVRHRRLLLDYLVPAPPVLPSKGGRSSF